MISTLGVAIQMSPLGWGATVLSTVGFIVMFGIASAKGDLQGLAKTTLSNDAAMRNKDKSKK